MDFQKFSVSMCVYGKDNPEWFRVAVDSILNQTVKPSEVVLVVDGPVPEELDSIICEYEKNPIFNVIRLKENGGLGNALKISVENSTYDIIARMDSDDISASDRFEKQLRLMEETGADIVGGYISEFIEDAENIVGIRDVALTDVEIQKEMQKRCPMNHMTVMFKKEAVLRAGNYQHWHYNEDYYLWLRMMLCGCTFANLKDALVNVRVGKDMYQRRGGWKYYKSERDLQKYMRKNKIIGFGTYFANVTKRFIVQVLLPNRLRGWVFQKFARKKVK